MKTLHLFLAGLVAVVVAGLLWWHSFWPHPNGSLEPKGKDGDQAWFADVTDEMGLDFVHDAGDVSKYQLPQIVGSGVAIFDFDGDGRPDIYLLSYGGPTSKSINRLYRNMPDGKFKDVTEGSGLGFAGWNTGVTIGDVNNDGRPDVLVTQYGGVKLFLNNGNGRFTDITEQAGLKNPVWATSACFFDYDRDGWLDLIVVNYVEDDPNWPCYNPTGKRDYCGPLIFKGIVSKLFRNRGGDPASLPRKQGKSATVRFEDVTVKAGLAKAPGPGLGVCCADFNGDGWPDIFIANDGKPNHLWINQKNGTFNEEALVRGIAVDSNGHSQAGMGVAIGDVDGNGLFDIYVTHLTQERHTLWQQGPERGEFRDQTARAGLLASDWRGTGWGTIMIDCDHDGWQDIAAVNGRILEGTATPNPALGDHFKHYSERNQIFRNEGKGKFRDVSSLNKAFCGTPNVARSLAYGDLDGDGALDLVITTVGGRARIYRNVARSPGHWLLVRAIDPRYNRDAYGAEIRIKMGDRRLLRIINTGDSFQCSNDPRAHFGLGDMTKIEGIHVLWPDGLAEVFEEGGAVDRNVVVKRGAGKAERNALR